MSIEQTGARMSVSEIRGGFSTGNLRLLSPLALERACYAVRVSCNNGEQHLRRLIRSMCALLPIAHGSERQVKPRGEFFLRQLQLLAQSRHRRHAARAPTAPWSPADNQDQKERRDGVAPRS